MTEVAAIAGGREEAPRHGLARHPWRWFFLIALVPVVVVVLRGSLWAVDQVNTDGFALLAALLVSWSCGRGEAPLVTARGSRIATFAAALVALLGIAWWYDGGPSGVVYSLFTVVVTATAISGAYAGTPALRDLVRPLLSVRASWPAWLVAALAWPLLGALVISVTRIDSAGQGLQLRSTLVPALILGSVAAALPAAIAWYGFAARRLLRVRSPLVVALLVGLVPWLAIVLPLSVWSSPLHQLAILATDPLDSFPLLTGLSALAQGLVAVWILQRSRVSLLPVLTYLSEAAIVSWVVFVLTDARWTSSDHLGWLLVGPSCLMALVLVVQGRMWGREGGDA